jgi:hypothetical protein
LFIGLNRPGVDPASLKSLTFFPEKVRRQSRSLRHLPLRNVSPDPAAARISRCFRGLCGRGFPPLAALRGPEVFSQGRYSLDLSTARIWCKACNLLKLLGWSLAQPEHFDVGRGSLNGPKSNFLISHSTLASPLCH